MKVKNQTFVFVIAVLTSLAFCKVSQGQQNYPANMTGTVSSIDLKKGLLIVEENQCGTEDHYYLDATTVYKAKYKAARDIKIGDRVSVQYSSEVRFGSKGDVESGAGGVATPRKYLMSITNSLSHGVSPTGPNATTNRDQSLRVSISRGRLSINGHDFSLPADRTQIIEALGKPTRETNEAVTEKVQVSTLTWDNRGIYTHAFNMTMNKISEFHIDFIRGNHEFSPRQTFSGILMVDGAILSGQSNIKDVNRLKKGKPFKTIPQLQDKLEIQDGDTVISLEQAGPRTEEMKACFKTMTVYHPW